MEASSVVLVCILVTCAVWTVHGRSFEVNVDDQKHVELEISMSVSKPNANLNKLRFMINGSAQIFEPLQQVPGLCWACKWALKKVKKAIGPNATAENLTMKLNSICKEIGILKPLCSKFVKTHLAELIEELTTTDDVRTICVNTGGCKPKELLDLLFDPRDEEASMEMNEFL